MTVHRSHRARQPAERDRGAALVVAIGFVVMVGAITAGLSSLVTSSLTSNIGLAKVRDRQYAADAAVEDAIVHVRRAIGDGTATCTPGTGTQTSGAASTELDGSAIRTEWAPACTTVLGAEGLVVVQHDVAFVACLDTGAACADHDVVLRAQVNFELDASGAVARTYVQRWSVER